MDERDLRGLIRETDLLTGKRQVGLWVSKVLRTIELALADLPPPVTVQPRGPEHGT